MNYVSGPELDKISKSDQASRSKGISYENKQKIRLLQYIVLCCQASILLRRYLSQKDNLP